MIGSQISDLLNFIHDRVSEAVDQSGIDPKTVENIRNLFNEAVDQQEEQTQQDQPHETTHDSADNGFIADELLPLFEPCDQGHHPVTQWLKEGNTLPFTFKEREYYLAYNEKRGKVQAFDDRGHKVDRTVQIETDHTVEGFIEIGGLKGLNRKNRLYLGVDDNNRFVMIEASAKLDKNKGDGDHVDTLLNDGLYHYCVPMPSDDDTANGTDPVDDGVDLFVFDDGGWHGDYVTSTAQHFAGEDIQIETYGVFDSAVMDPSEIPTETVSRERAVAVAEKTLALFKQQFPNWQDNESLTTIVAGLTETSSDFAQSAESLGDYILLNDVMDLLKLTGSPEVQTQVFPLKIEADGVLKTHRENYPTDDPNIASVNNGSLALDTRTRIVFFQATPDKAWYTQGYAQTLFELNGLSRQIGNLSVEQLAENFISGAVAGGELEVQASLESGLSQANLVDAEGNIIPVEGFDADNQPIRIINMSLATSITQVIKQSAFFDLMDILPAGQDSVLVQSLGSHLSEPMQQQLAEGTLSVGDAARAATANVLVGLAEDPNSTLHQTLTEIDQQTTDRVDELLDANILIVMSAGNEDDDIPGALPQASDNLLATENMIVVGATDDQNTPELSDDVVAEFSSYGADFVVDGVDVYSTDGALKTGTSLSAPTVSAWLAKVLDSNDGSHSARDVLEILRNPEQSDTLFLDIQDTDRDGAGILLPDGLSEVFNHPSSEPNVADQVV